MQMTLKTLKTLDDMVTKCYYSVNNHDERKAYSRDDELRQAAREWVKAMEKLNNLRWKNKEELDKSNLRDKPAARFVEVCDDLIDGRLYSSAVIQIEFIKHFFNLEEKPE
jgi:hypothetical protein